MFLTWGLIAAIIFLIGGTVFPHRGVNVYLHPWTARIAGVLFIALFALRYRFGGHPILLTVVGSLAMLMTAISMILGVTQGRRQ